MPRVAPALLLALTLTATLTTLSAAEGPPGLDAVLGVPGSADGSIGGSAVAITPGHALSLQEAFAKPVSIGERVELLLPGGRRRTATVERTGPTTTAVLLALDLGSAVPLPIADPARLGLGAPVWTIGNSTGAVEDDGVPAISGGTVSGRYELAAGGPAMRGRAGRVLSTYSGPVIEIDAAVNDGNQGGAVVDGDGRLVALATLGFARERRLGTAVPIDRLLADVGLPPPPAGPPPRDAPPLPTGLVLIAFDRPEGLGNPDTVPRPAKVPEQVPAYERDRLEKWWDAYFHSQQVLWTDSPSPALLIDPARGLLLTAASNLHGGATTGRVLLADGSVAVEILAIDRPLDLALLKAVGPVPLPAAVIEPVSPSLGEAVAVVARHRPDAGPTRTAGIVSCASRRLARADVGFIQVDARANYGSLGGAVADARGRIVGLVVKSGPEAPWLINSGVTLAIDGATIARALPALLAGTSRDELPFLGLGVQLEPADDLLIVRGVLKGSPAETAGIAIGDTLAAVDGRPVPSQMAVTRALLHHGAGDTVRVELRRRGRPLAMDIVLKEFAP